MFKYLFSLALIFLVFNFFVCSEKKSEEEYFKTAQDFFNKEEFQSAIENYSKIIDYYPNGINSPKSLFMIAYIYANHIKNYEEAKKYYTMFIEKYPDHDLTRSAEYELETLGQDINELSIFKKIEEENAKSEKIEQ